MNLKLDSNKISSNDCSIEDVSKRSHIGNHDCQSDDIIDGLNLLIPRNVTTYADHIELRKQ